MAESKDLFGNTYTARDTAVAIPIERYNELIKKEAFYDEIVQLYDRSLILLTKPRTEGTNGDNV